MGDIRAIRDRHADELMGIEDPNLRANKLTEYNVLGTDMIIFSICRSPREEKFARYLEYGGPPKTRVAQNENTIALPSVT